MASYFGFAPSDKLKNQIAAARSARAADEKKLYVHRDGIVHSIVHELIDTVLGDLVALLPEGDKKHTMEKMVSIVDSTAQKLINQILGKDDNKQVFKTLDFFENKTLNKDTSGDERVGFQMDAGLYTRMNKVFGEVQAGNGEAQRDEMIAVFNDFTDANLDHFMLKFADSLDLGFIKRKLLPIAEAAIAKGVKMGIKRLLPMLHQEEMQRMTEHYQATLFEA